MGKHQVFGTNWRARRISLASLTLEDPESSLAPTIPLLIEHLNEDNLQLILSLYPPVAIETGDTLKLVAGHLQVRAARVILTEDTLIYVRIIPSGTEYQNYTYSDALLIPLLFGLESHSQVIQILEKLDCDTPEVLNHLLPSLKTKKSWADLMGVSHYKLYSRTTSKRTTKTSQ
jgi:hypothetical protein